MVLERPDAISKWRALIGPTDARKAKTSHPNRLRAMLFLFLYDKYESVFLRSAMSNTPSSLFC
jgi:nucleoside diphosphate kinase